MAVKDVLIGCCVGFFVGGILPHFFSNDSSTSRWEKWKHHEELIGSETSKVCRETLDAVSSMRDENAMRRFSEMLAEILAAIKKTKDREDAQTVVPQQLHSEGNGDPYGQIYEMSRKYFDYESPLPKWPPPESVVNRFQRLPDLFDWNIQEQIKLWQGFISKGYAKKSPSKDILRGFGGMYPDLDRTFLFYFVAHIKPSRILEIGSGESTHVVKAALEVNGYEDTEHTAIEPYRASAVPKSVKIIKQEMQTIGFEAFDKLGRDDMLFIDSSHVTMPYGDTLVELLTILPRLATGVLVHIHDIFLPYDYKKSWGLKNKVYTEQWLVALLLYGAKDEWEVIWGSRIMMTEHSDVIRQMPEYPASQPDGGALWLRKNGAPIRN